MEVMKITRFIAILSILIGTVLFLLTQVIESRLFEIKGLQMPQINDRQNTEQIFVMSYVYNDILAENPDTYYTDSVNRTGGALTEVSPPYFNLNLNGELEDINRINPNFIREMHKKSIKVIPYLTDNWNEIKASAALENKEELVQQLLRVMEEFNLDGVNVDIEHVTDKDRNTYNDFIKLLRENLPDEKVLSVAVAANPNGWTTGWHGAYDYSTLAQFSDYLMLMTYDEHSLYHETPGPVASLPFVEKTIQYALDQDVPSEKIVMGVPFYGRIWKSDNSINGLDVSLIIANNLIDLYDGQVFYDQEKQSPMATFTIKQNDDSFKLEKWGQVLTPGTYTLWYENEKSIKAKQKLVQKYKLKGTGIWSLGQEPDGTWDYFTDF
jgi:spore germination protein YaaH